MSKYKGIDKISFFYIAYNLLYDTYNIQFWKN